jgi:microcystin-dependent protein
MHLKNAWFFFFLAAAFSVFGQTGGMNSIEVEANGNVRIDTPNLIVNGIEYSILPQGAIIMWSGTKVPDGWILCDGTSYTDSDNAVINTPDLRGRFIVGYTPEDGDGVPDYHRIGNVGGEKSHVLSVNEMPVHTHSASSSENGYHDHYITAYHANFSHGGSATEGSTKEDGDGTFYVGTSGAGSHSHSIGVGASGSSAAHENRPPYYVLAYIMKVKGKGLGTTLTP